MNTYKTPFSKRVQILGELWFAYHAEDTNDEGWKQFFRYYDISLPMAYLTWQDYVTINQGADMYIDDAWNDLFIMLGLDGSAAWDSLEEVLEKVQK